MSQRKPTLTLGVNEYALVMGRQVATAEYGDPCILAYGTKLFISLIHETDTGERLSLLGERIMVAQLRPVVYLMAEYDEEDGGKPVAFQPPKAITTVKPVASKGAAIPGPSMEDGTAMPKIKPIDDDAADDAELELEPEDEDADEDADGDSDDDDDAELDDEDADDEDGIEIDEDDEDADYEDEDEDYGDDDDADEDDSDEDEDEDES